MAGPSAFPSSAIVGVAAQRVLARLSSGSGAIEEATLSDLLTAMLAELPTEAPAAGGPWLNNGVLTMAEMTPPTITSQPESVATSPGNTATFTVAATGAESYQWQVNSGSGYENITGATEASYTTGELSLSDNGKLIRCVVTGPGGSTTSSAATLTVVNALYADSVNGSDSNDGRTLQTAKQTLSAARAIASAGDTLYLARGSYWREQLTIPVENFTITTAGTGAMPVIDGADIVTDTWTQPDAATYPDVWSVSWTRSGAATTGSAIVGMWIDGVQPRYATSLADLQANGGAYFGDRVATTTTAYIKSSVDPNTSGVLYEITRRRHCIGVHSGPAGQLVVGPVELKRAIEHYNAHSAGPGEARRTWLRDGHVHHTVTEGSLTEDCVATGVVKGVIGATNPFVAYRAVGTGFSHTFRRCASLYPGGSSRPGLNAFYAHGSTPTTLDSFLVEGSFCRGSAIGSADAAAVEFRDSYCEEVPPGPAVSIIGTSATAEVTRILARDLTAVSHVNGNRFVRRASGNTAITIRNCASRTLGGAAIENSGGTATRLTMINTALVTTNNAIAGGNLSMSYSVIQSDALMFSLATIINDFNIYSRPGLAYVQGTVGGTAHNSLGAWQAATGQDTNSVFVKTSEQTGANALWLGIAEGTSQGPVDGDFRINPNAKVYNGAGIALFGTFADGTTPLTLAGPQEHYNFNARSVVAGPPTRWPVLPANDDEVRVYMDDPTAWDFYP